MLMPAPQSTDVSTEPLHLRPSLSGEPSWDNGKTQRHPVLPEEAHEPGKLLPRDSHIVGTEEDGSGVSGIPGLAPDVDTAFELGASNVRSQGP